MNITTRFYSNDTLEKFIKKEIIILKNDTIQEIYYVDNGDGMFETNNFKQFTSTQKKGNKELFSTYRYEKTWIYNSSPKKYWYSKYIEKKTVYYNHKGLIKKIVISNDELDTRYKNIEITTLTPKKLN